MKAALVAAITQLATAHPTNLHMKRENGLSVELTDAGAAGVGMKVTNTGAESVKLLTYATLLDDAPVNKLKVVQDGMSLHLLVQGGLLIDCNRRGYTLHRNPVQLRHEQYARGGIHDPWGWRVN